MRFESQYLVARLKGPQASRIASYINEVWVDLIGPGFFAPR